KATLSGLSEVGPLLTEAPRGVQGRSHALEAPLTRRAKRLVELPEPAQPAAFHFGDQEIPASAEPRPDWPRFNAESTHSVFGNSVRPLDLAHDQVVLGLNHHTRPPGAPGGDREEDR